ncbi:MAG TPA: contractile injection system protein, VgrG/Pvc8 family [Candidatus Sulfotelmatobacter sp.]|nr:contractile injection system protein, VgrG/Pvc8 family [Candidatus Sulfotelmatobacter sp.]
MIPDFRIKAGTADVTGHIRKNLVSLRLTDKTGMEADQVEIVIADKTGSIALPKRGVTLSVAIGWKDRQLVEKGTFTVDEVGEDGPLDCITILARSADFRTSLKDSREASYNSTTLGAILTTIASRNGLTPAISPTLGDIEVIHLDQTNESDANLVTRLGDDYGAVATIKSGKLIFVPAGSGLTASGQTLPAASIVRKEGDRHSFRATDRDGSQTGIQAKWHDLKSGSTCFALAGKEGSVKTLKRTYPDQAAAQAAADSAWERQKSQSHSFNVTLAIGRPEIAACSPLTLSGWRSEITALSWISDDVAHTLDGSGLTTEIQASERSGEDD